MSPPGAACAAWSRSSGDVEVRDLKSGKRKEKVSYAERQRCASYLVERLDRGRSAEQILGVVLQALIAAHSRTSG